MTLPDRITAELGLTPDETAVRGSKQPGPPPLPRHHLWLLSSGVSETARLDDQLEALLERLRPSLEALHRLRSSSDVEAGLSIVRHFEPGPEAQDVLASRDANVPTELQVLRGQHPLLGFHLDERLLATLATAGLSLDFDEYADEFE